MRFVLFFIYKKKILVEFESFVSRSELGANAIVATTAADQTFGL